MRKTTISCDGCKSPCEQAHSSGGVLARTWLEMHVTHGIVAHMDVCFCATCKDQGPLVYRTMMRRLAEEEAKILHHRKQMREEQAAAASDGN